MPRQPRFYYPGAVLHVVQRGNDRGRVFVGDHDRRFFVRCLIEASRTHGVAVHAYVLMTNHVHLLVSPGDEHAMPRTMQTLGRRYVEEQHRWERCLEPLAGLLDLPGTAAQDADAPAGSSPPSTS